MASFRLVSVPVIIGDGLIAACIRRRAYIVLPPTNQRPLLARFGLQPDKATLEK